MRLGSAEVWVEGRSGRMYASPNLIYHYIRDCGYQPPAEYVQAVLELADLA